ncbi:MAG: type II toxin-antitoxin system RelB/DinJ family antitoxin [Anaerolineaceae bacterium]|nr:type II toxin-antitoxin system RelB/DinJ family antitoxin [Anaerolineaceae bacterium]
MSVSSIRIDDSVKNETVRIANRLGLTFNAVIDISLRQFNRNKGFAEPLCLDDETDKTYMEMSPREMESVMQETVLTRDKPDTDAFVTMFDESGRVYRQYDDGRVEYVLS